MAFIVRRRFPCYLCLTNCPGLGLGYKDLEPDMTWFLIFAATVFALYFWLKHRAHQAEQSSPLAEQNLGLRFIGQSLVLEAPIQNNAGRIFLGNREWRVRGPNLPIGSRVRVTGVDGTVLLVDRTGS
jgi:membrane protein implicated in regulation of membrane protease activity